MSVIELGESVPALTPHATSVSLPKWKDNIDYEEGNDRVLSKLTTGYPRFFVHKLITSFAEDIVRRRGGSGLQAMLFPSSGTARSCVKFMRSRIPASASVDVVDLVLDHSKIDSELLRKVSPTISAVVFSQEHFSIAKQYWQHSGDGVSSRRAEFCHSLYQDGILVERKTPQSPTTNGHQKTTKGPRRYQRQSVDISPTKPMKPDTVCTDADHVLPTNGAAETQESTQFLEERFGRNLNVSFVHNAKTAIRRRISGSLVGDIDLAATPTPVANSNMRGVSELSEDDVYLYPCGMNSIFNAHKLMLEARGPMKSISYGFPYIDTLKVLEKFGPGCVFYGNGSSDDLDDLEARLKSGERFLALFCEFPGNPMLSCPDLQRIRKLADMYDFGVVVDETIGNFINVHVLPLADVVVSSLTKIFSGECNVMGGATILNPHGRYYQILKQAANNIYEDNYWAEDAIFMERNSRHFVTRIERINHNAEVICDILQTHPLVKDLYYPKHNPSRVYYDACRTPNGGYGGLLSFVFHKISDAVAFYDRLETAKGPSLGTNFTLTSPYVILAHYMELDWAAQYGVPAHLIRISVGLEDEEDLRSRFAVALKAAEVANV